MNEMDDALRRAFPLVPVSVTGQPAPPAQFGTRYLVARQGLFREVTLPWIRVCHLIAPSGLPLPYGEAADTVQFRCGPIPAAILQAFVVDARQAQPLETAGVLLWNASDDSWRYVRREATQASGSHLQYDEVRPGHDEHIVIDVHSHGIYPAFFSPQDDADDAGAMKASLVLGNLDCRRPTSRMRLCMAGLVRPAWLRGDDQLELQA